ncbi:alpha/beta fold hydrolase [Acinetobacter tianfuensis]|uniref:Alpha/beta hydrolase n=1 Tax=Acinetobacter tianfuensis TaxID=2419603 RepID=A0A3A8EHD7_9GAMM|nr:alpha/beta hydrolase [Acinetobacter tianfuensis]RKG33985.1 alpha/beta hydrolase [Acinetobacter tianfuensis]
MPHYQMPDGEKLYVRTYGSGQPVLVLSGLGMQSWQWHPFLYRSRKQFEFIIPDWRGFGGSKQCQIPELDAIPSHWRDISSLMQQLNQPALHVIAYSMGATTAMHGMKYGQFAQQIKSYLHIDQTPKISADTEWPYGLFGNRHPEFIQILQQISQVLQDNPTALYMNDLSQQARNQLLHSWLAFIDLQASSKTAPFFIKAALRQPKLQPHILPIKRLDYLSWYISNYLQHTEDYRDAVAALTCPATFFIGEQSKLYPAAGQHIVAQSAVNAESIVFHKSGHTPLLSEPVKFSQEIQRHLTRISQLQSG